MATKRIFSLRLTESVREKLLGEAEVQGMTITALINRYITEGLERATQKVEPNNSLDTESRLIKPKEEEVITELILQVLQNQRVIIGTCNELKQNIEPVSSQK